MPLFSKELSPADRVVYSRWVGGLFAVYTALLIGGGIYVAHHVASVPSQVEAADDACNTLSTGCIAPPPARQYVKYD